MTARSSRPSRRQRRSEARFFLTFEPDPAGEVLQTGYSRFTHESGIRGLAMTRPGRLDILAAAASRPGRGQFREFIRSACRTFATVAVWLDWNPVAGEALRRYGFAPVSIPDERENPISGWEWKRPDFSGTVKKNTHETHTREART